jgi:predicted nucleotidyltransferase
MKEGEWMCTKSQLGNILIDVVNETKNLFGAKLNAVILYGSYARGDYDGESDIDILIIADIPQDECWHYNTRLITLISQLELDNDIVISTHVVERAMFERFQTASPFYRNVTREGIKIAG